VNRELDVLLEMIAGATSRIADEYFQLPVADADEVYRERVYCYELYHQLRSGWGSFPFSLGGEVDKSGNPYFEGGPYARAKPDMLVHTPGDMNRNLAVVEIKSIDVGIDGIRVDLQKLTWFCENARYFAGIFIVYGDAGADDILQQRIRQANAPDIDFRRLRFFHHRHAGTRPEALNP
jgi:hypothetical protein